MSTQARTTVAHLVVLAALRLAVSLLVWRLGFTSISDDDFARVTISQAFAAAPRLDPTGTSWLPLPFWLTGGLMSVFGATLTTARVAAIAAAVASSWGLYAAARASGSSPRASLAASIASTLMPVSALTAVATVPELPTATLCACALLLLRRRDRAGLFAAALCVLPATLARYESWPVAVVVAAAAWVERPHRSALGHAARSIYERAAITSLALCGIGAWLAWNRFAHGDALHFHARVSSFWFASGHAHVQALADLLRGYPWTTVAGVPALTTLTLGAVWLVHDRSVLHPWRRPLAGAAVVVVALTVMQATGGAPTHHPERALMLAWMIVWTFATDLLDRAPIVHRVRWISAGAAAIVIALLGRELIAQATHPECDRSAEVLAGSWLRAHAAHDRVLLDPVDYGYFALIAAGGSPERFALSRSIDPRDAAGPSPFETERRLVERIGQTNAAWVVVRADRSNVADTVADRTTKQGGWDILRVR